MIARKKLKQSGTEEFQRWLSDGLVSRQDKWGINVDPDSVEAPEPYEDSTVHEIIDEAVGHLQGRQAEVYVRVMRCGLSLAAVASELQISKGVTQTYLARAIKFVSGYCKEAIATGRI